MIGILGLGRMGTAMAGRLLATGHDVTVWNRTAGRTGALVDAGATVAGTPADAAAGADVVITMLADPAAVRAVLVAAGAAAAMRPGSCLVEMSTIGPDAVKALVEHLPDGVGLVDAPVLGSVPKARTGELTVLAGGDVAAVEPVLASLGRVTRCGDLGSGAALKLVLMTAMIGGVAVVGEALRVADALGVGRDRALAALAAGPLAGAVARATATATDSDYPIALAAKDLDLATAAPPGRTAGTVPAARTGDAVGQGRTALPVTVAVRDELRRLAAAGSGQADLSEIGG